MSLCNNFLFFYWSAFFHFISTFFFPLFTLSLSLFFLNHLQIWNQTEAQPSVSSAPAPWKTRATLQERGRWGRQKKNSNTNPHCKLYLKWETRTVLHVWFKCCDIFQTMPRRQSGEGRDDTIPRKPLGSPSRAASTPTRTGLSENRCEG